MLDMKMLREARRFVTVGGKGTMERRRSLGHWRIAAAGLPLLFVPAGRGDSASDPVPVNDNDAARPLYRR